MAILKYISLFQLAAATPHISTWGLRDLTSQCALGGTSSISFNYYPADKFSINTDSFLAGDCDFNDVTISYGTATDIDGKSIMPVTISYDPSVCSTGTNPVAGDLSTYSSDTQFSFDAGVTAHGQFLSFRSHVIPAKCTYEASYSLEYNFGQIQKETEYGETDDNDPSTPDVQSTEGGITFQMVAYSDSARTSPIQSDVTTAGDMSYVTISPTFSMPNGFSYAPVECKLTEVDSTCTDNCNDINSFSLFNLPDKNCQGSEELLDFTMAYDSSNAAWNFAFMLFLFNPDDINEYKLVCDIRVCTTSGDPAGTCNAVAQSCLHSNAADFFTECQSDEVYNLDTNTCESTGIVLNDPTFVSFQETDSFDGHPQYGVHVDNDFIYVCGKEHQKPIIWAYRTSDYQLEKRYQHGNDRVFLHIIVTDKFIIASHYDEIEDGGGIVVFDKESTDVISHTPHDSPQFMALDGDNLIVAAYGSPQAFYKIDDNGAVTQQAAIEGSTTIVKARAAGFDANFFYIGGEYNGNNVILAYDKTSLTIQKVFTGHTHWVTDIITLTHPTLGDILISNSFDNTVRVFDVQTGDLIKAWLKNVSGLRYEQGYLFATTLGTRIDIFDFDEILNSSTSQMTTNMPPMLTATHADMRYCQAVGFNAESKQLVTGCNMDGVFFFQL